MSKSPQILPEMFYNGYIRGQNCAPLSYFLTIENQEINNIVIMLPENK